MTLLAMPSIGTVVTDLATCLCGLVSDPDSGVPDVCFCGVIPGEAASAMYGGNCRDKCGMAWVRVVTAYAAAGAGNQTSEPGNCNSGIGFDVEVGMLRCTPIGEATTPPKPEQLLASAQLQWADMMIMRKAVACCAGVRDWVLGTYTPMGPAGGLVGGFWTIQMWTP